MTLILALNYSARWEIVEAVKKISAEAKDGLLDPETIDSDVINKCIEHQGNS